MKVGNTVSIAEYYENTGRTLGRSATEIWRVQLEAGDKRGETERRPIAVRWYATTKSAQLPVIQVGMQQAVRDGSHRRPGRTSMQKRDGSSRCGELNPRNNAGNTHSKMHRGPRDAPKEPVHNVFSNILGMT